MICQLNSALARADTYVREALLAIHQRDYTLASAKLGGALGALDYAGNSQTRLIDAVNGLVIANHGLPANPADETDPVCRAAIEQGLAAITHATGPGID